MSARRSVVVGLVVSAIIGAALLGAPVAGAVGLAADGPRVTGSEFTLNGVSCVSRSNCMAVGDYANGSGDSLPLSESWNGTSWTAVKIHGPLYSGLEDVSCPKPSDCVAVGFSRYGTLSEIWNGSEWNRVASPAPRGQISSTLLSVSCPSRSNCTAVGFYVNGSSKWLTLAESWNGTSWSLVASPSPRHADGSELAGVACARAASCVAVGDTFTKTGNTHTLAESWNGARWRVVASPDNSAGSENTLMSTSCTSASDCTAVGDYFALSGTAIPIIENWNGVSWTLVAGQTASGELDSVSCPNAARCAAVGEGPNGTFTEIRRGTTWRVVASPNPKGALGGILAGVSCATSSSCDAVGYYTGEASDTTYNLAETWNGVEWELSRAVDA
jgi:hypothetical protein